jgi:soluble epoxide hydrolase / lipid-phosphate phosphatase
MEQLTKKTFTTSRSFTYQYYTHSGSDAKKPTLVLCHGWPDDAHLWDRIVPALIPLGFSIVAFDLLGYGGTSKPTDTASYSLKDMTDEIYEILDFEKVGPVIPVGHDFGSATAQRVYLWKPDRCVGLILLNVAYIPPNDQPFDVATINDMTEKMIGYPMYAYWELFSIPEGGKILSQHVESVYAAVHGEAPDWTKQMFCVRGAFRDFVENDKTVPVHAYAQDPAFRENFVGRFKRDGFEAPQCWYRATVENILTGGETSALSQDDLVIKSPVLFLGCTRDPVCLTGRIYEYEALLPNLTVKEIDSGHWCTYEKPQEVNNVLTEWLKETFS